jgi:Pro-kumamolisin, activation domain/Bacterial Ig-like domain (group 3)
MRSWMFLVPFLASTLCLAAQPDRLAGPIDSSQKMPLKGNVHSLAQPGFEIGRTDGSMVLHGVTLAFRPSAAQQADLNNLLAQQQDRKSPNYHKWLTPSQFADRFGMTQNDIASVTGWLESQGLTVVLVANSRNQISFEGTVGQIESVFSTEIHDYLVDGEIHFANATNPSVPAALAPSVLSVGHLHNFNPKPRAIFRRTSSTDPHFTSHISGDHFLTPGDFATIYDIQSVYNNGIDGTGQKVAITGQSSINLADVSNFRSAAGLAANAPTLLLMPGTGTSTRCAKDEGESDLDVEWSGGVAKNASITLVYAGLASGDTCTKRQFGAFDALQYAIDQNVAPIISNSYGNCESAFGGNTFPLTMQGWMQQANAQGQTVITASGDTGAADCEPSQSPSATTGPAVDIPAAIPEVTGMGGTEFNGDAEATVANGNANPTSFWSGTTNGTDAISSALSYIPEMAWNDTSAAGELLASGGGASIIFPKPSWQTGAGVPNDNHRYVPDLALNASPDHDPYLYCSEDGANDTIVATCTSGFRDSSSNLAAVGGTSAAAPTFSAIIALLNQQLGTFGLGNINPNLYSLAASNPTAFNDIIAGNNIVPCTRGSSGCPTAAPFQFGFMTETGYDQVTGLGSVNASALFSAWPATRGPSSVVISSSASTINAGTSVTFTAKVTASAGAGVGTVSFSTLNNGSTLALGKATLNTGTATFATAALPAGNNGVTATYEGDAGDNPSTSIPASVTVSDFTLSVTNALSPSSISAGQLASAILTLTPVNGSTQTINFANSLSSNTGPTPGSCTAGLPTGALCTFSPTSVTLDGTHSVNVTLTVSTAANMALGTDSITVTGVASGTGGSSHSANVSLTVTATNESFTLASTNGATFVVPVGGTAAVQFLVSSTTGFVNSINSTTNVPLTYTCSGIPNTAEITCQFTPNNGEVVAATAVTMTLITTPKTVQLNPLFRSRSIFYALLLPGLFGIVFAAGPVRRSRLRRTTLLVFLGVCTLGLGACGGSGNSGVSKNAGTPPATYTVSVSASTGGANPLTATAPAVTLNVTP